MCWFLGNMVTLGECGGSCGISVALGEYGDSRGLWWLLGNFCGSWEEGVGSRELSL